MAAYRSDDIVSSPDPVIEAYKNDIDRTLLVETLRLTVEQRFRRHQQLLEFAAKFRGVARKRA